MTQELPKAGAVEPYPEPDADAVRDLLLDWCGAEPEDAEDAAAGLAALDGEARELADRCYQSIAADMGGKKWLAWPKPPEAHPLLGLYPLLAAVPGMIRFHRERGVDEDLSRRLLTDVGEKLRLNRRLHGRAGLDVANWFTGHVRGALYQLGRLQFCVEGPEPKPFVGVHIRGEGGPLTLDAVRDSVEWALEFFPTVFPERYDGPDDLVFMCESWLLDPQLRDWLPERSNIPGFGALFDLEGPGDPAGNRSDLWRFVFNRTEDTPVEELPRDNTLQRSVLAGIEAGVPWRNRSGRLNLARLGL
ncbi:acyltransferase domain-containing protein [Glycomyces sp. TRM65418]|uniref:acyltransferase domain-containing protein n=1 Tax=Glycomyces sp. TRM65418 TaxID=2867006 RepID=UPI001CE6A485|nr:acyltransferase domain-containing protein [Glycomyces sp. TRM65418]MCC3762087.1 acyltransferase domain-containing protein [Glycomyces sp. TRM65418]QZD56155.1 acyltransferase domain-containing protein [Glycomyces sp. TRM65418]